MQSFIIPAIVAIILVWIFWPPKIKQPKDEKIIDDPTDSYLN
jgi:uncharacterized membrane protein YdfJ with MMPL/SSD domain